VCPIHGEVTRKDVVKGYQYAADQFVILNEADLEAVRLDTTSTIELVQFIGADQLDPMFLDSPYYVGPDGPVAEEGFAVLREALRRAKRIAVGRVVLGGKEKLVALKPQDKGLVLFTLRRATEVRASPAYFEDVRQQQPDAAQVGLAQKLIDSKSRALDLANFTNRFQAAFLNIIKARVNGTAPVLVPRSQVGPIINLMDALRKSVEQAEKGPEPVRKRRKMRVAL
jgi:DNA end-binding protein Ku